MIGVGCLSLPNNSKLNTNKLRGLATLNSQIYRGLLATDFYEVSITRYSSTLSRFSLYRIISYSLDPISSGRHIKKWGRKKTCLNPMDKRKK